MYSSYSGIALIPYVLLRLTQGVPGFFFVSSDDSIQHLQADFHCLSQFTLVRPCGILSMLPAQPMPQMPDTIPAPHHSIVFT